MMPERAAISSDFLANVQPVVLVGGRSRRFGRDKLREPWGTGKRLLVQYPMDALRSVFGPRVEIVGACDPTIEHQADGVVPDLYPGIGPMGGIVSALAHRPGTIFVLAGDMPCLGATEITAILRIAQDHPNAHAVCASTDRLHPCAAVYTPCARPILEACVLRGDYTLLGALGSMRVLSVPVAPDAAHNVNVPGDVQLVDVRPGRPEP